MKRITLDDLFKIFETFDEEKSNGVFNFRSAHNGNIEISESGATLYILRGYSECDFKNLYSNIIKKTEKRNWRYETFVLNSSDYDSDSYSGNSVVVGIDSKGVAINLQNDSFAKNWKGRK